jgi:hypothetical protein
MIVDHVLETLTGPGLFAWRSVRTGHFAYTEA